LPDDEPDGALDGEAELEDESEDELEALLDDALLRSESFAAPSFVFDAASPEVLELLAPDEFEDRESVMYQPLPLKTMPTGWMILRNVPPHWSQVVSGGSEKL
jgi:hypothetical protein